MKETKKELRQRLRQMILNCNFLITEMDKCCMILHISGTWQERASKLVDEVSKIKQRLAEVKK